MNGIRAFLGEDSLIEPRRQRINQVHRLREFFMFLRRNLGRDEAAEMADALVQCVDDGLPARRQRLVIVIEVEDPPQCLLGWGDIVAPGAEDYDGRLDVAKINADIVGEEDLAACEFVADEQFVGNELHFGRVQQNRAAPPLLEF